MIQHQNNMEMVQKNDRPKSISQSWREISYDWKKKKFIIAPIFFVRYEHETKKHRVTLEQGLDLIKKGYLFANDTMKEWLIENRREDVSKKIE